jgi:hypothetical protein
MNDDPLQHSSGYTGSMTLSASLRWSLCAPQVAGPRECRRRAALRDGITSRHPEPFGTYVESIQTGTPMFLTGMLATQGRTFKSTASLLVRRQRPGLTPTMR